MGPRGDLAGYLLPISGCAVRFLEGAVLPAVYVSLRRVDPHGGFSGLDVEQIHNLAPPIQQYLFRATGRR